MAAVLSNPAISCAITCNMSGGAAPAPATAVINDATARQATVGSSAGNVNKIYSAVFTVTNGTPLVFDVTSLTDALGNALNFGTVYAIKITNSSTTAGQDFTLYGGTNPILAASTELCYANGGVKLLDTGTTGIAISGSVKTIQITVAAGTGVAGVITIIGK